MIFILGHWAIFNYFTELGYYFVVPQVYLLAGCILCSETV